MLNGFGNFLSGGANLLTCMVVLPVFIGGLLWLERKNRTVCAVIALLYAVLNLLFAGGLFTHAEFYVKLPFAPAGFSLSFNVSDYSSFFVLFAACVTVLIVIYTLVWLKKASYGGLYLLYLFISVGLLNGALLSDNLGFMLFFWEGLLCTLLGILLIGHTNKPKTAIKALTVSGIADLLLMLGIIVTGHQAGTFNVSEMSTQSITGIGAAGFILLILGAFGKSGVLPFHSWLPNAADDAPTVFMVAFPSAFEKIIGMFLAARAVFEIYRLEPGSAMSIALMSLGALTILVGAMMALVQTDMKRILVYHTISQLGYMVLGVGTGLTVGLVGAVFHMMNHVTYKTGLFMVTGSIEKQTGTTDLRKLSGLKKTMPGAALCFLIFALSYIGFPGLNGFFSKELIFDAALESAPVFYVIAALGSFLTALSFFRTGRSLFYGEHREPQGEKLSEREKMGLLAPAGVFAVVCVLFGLGNFLPLDKMVGPALGVSESFSGLPKSAMLVIISVVVLLAAYADHAFGYKKSGSALCAVDHITGLPGLKQLMSTAKKGLLDPYNWLLNITDIFSKGCTALEHGVSWVYDIAIPGAVGGVGTVLHRFDNGRLSRYLWLVVGGVALIFAVFLIVLAKM